MTKSPNLDRSKSAPKYFRMTPAEPAPLSSSTQAPLAAIGAFLLILCLFGVFNEFSRSTPTEMPDFLGILVLCLGSIGALAMIIFGLGQGAVNSVTKERHEQELREYYAEFEKSEPKPSDQQMDEWLRNDLKSVKADAWRKLGLNRSEMVSDPEKPLLVIGPARNAAVAVGKDGQVRFSRYDILIVHLTHYHLAAYKCTLDFATGGRPSESTQEYRYSDVVSVSTSTASDFVITIDEKTVSLPSVQRFALSVASGDKITVSALQRNADQIVGLALRGQLPESGMDEAITRIRAMLREKRGGA